MAQPAPRSDLCRRRDAVEVLEHPPGCFQLRAAGLNRSEGGYPVVAEVVEAGELEVAAAEDLGFEYGSGSCWADALEATGDFDHPRCEPAGDMETGPARGWHDPDAGRWRTGMSRTHPRQPS